MPRSPSSPRRSERNDREKYERRRSRTPPHVRDRERERERERERYRERDRRERRRSPEKSSRSLRSRSRSPGGRRDRALSPRSSERRDPKYDRERKSKADSPSRKEEVTTPSEGSSNNLLGDIDPDENPEQALMALMGMTGFSSTKGKKVTGNETSAVNIKKQRQYRQYMNRRGGFNRPLDRVQ